MPHATMSTVSFVTEAESTHVSVSGFIGETRERKVGLMASQLKPVAEAAP